MDQSEDSFAQHRKSIRVSYKMYRRRGYTRLEAAIRAETRANRLAGMMAVMKASDWKADPLRLALQAKMIRR